MNRPIAPTRILTLALVLTAATLLSACTERPQTLGTASSQDQDRTSWQRQLKTRAQYGQNDYSRMGG